MKEEISLSKKTNWTVRHIENDHLSWEEIAEVLQGAMRDESKDVFQDASDLLCKLIEKRPDLVISHYPEIVESIYDGISVERGFSVSFFDELHPNENPNSKVLNSLEKIIEISPDNARANFQTILYCIKKGLLHENFLVNRTAFHLLVKVADEFPNNASEHRDLIKECIGYNYPGI